MDPDRNFISHFYNIPIAFFMARHYKTIMIAGERKASLKQGKTNSFVNERAKILVQRFSVLLTSSVAFEEFE